MNWQKQTSDKPLFPDVLWSRPENRRHAGKLLIIGGHQQEFNEVSAAYSAALKAGSGTVRVILPDSLQKMLHKLFPEAEYASSTPIGSFSRQALGTLLGAAQWADAVLLAGDFGKNSETAIMLESFVEKYPAKLALAGDSLDYFLNQPDKLIFRRSSLIIGSLNQFQKLAAPALIQQNADLIKVVEQISDWVSKTDLAVVTIHSDQVIVAVGQQISTSPVKREPHTAPDPAKLSSAETGALGTMHDFSLRGSLAVPSRTAPSAPREEIAPSAQLSGSREINFVEVAAYATVWWLQQPEKPFEALTSAIFCLLT